MLECFSVVFVLSELLQTDSLFFVEVLSLYRILSCVSEQHMI